MKLTHIAMVLLSGVLAGEALAASEESKAAVNQAVRDVMKAVETAQAKEDAAKNAPKAAAVRRTDSETEKAAKKEVENYPAIPAKYLRPDADPKEQKTAIDDMKRSVEAGNSKVEAGKKTAAGVSEAETAPKKPAAAVGRVEINKNPVIAMRPGENVFIPISREHPNRLLTPFKNPQIISTSLFTSKKKGECGEACVRDGIIYITTDSPSAVTAFITDKGHEEIAFSVTMVPQAIPPREVRFTLPEDVVERLSTRTRSNSVSESRQAQAWEQSQPYVETIRRALRSVALGQIPDGYNLRQIRVTDPLPTCRHPGLDFKWNEGQLLEGYNLDIYVGVVQNVADSPVEFRNQNCGGWRTAAVTSWPLTVLEPGEESEVYVVVKREDEVPADMVRKPLISRSYN